MIPVGTQKLSYSAVVTQGETSPVSRDSDRQQLIRRHIQSIRNSSNNIFQDKACNYRNTSTLSRTNISRDANQPIVELYKNKKKTLLDVLKITTTLIKKSNDPEVVFHLVENLKKSKITPNRIIYNAYMHILANAGKPEQARKVLNEMRNKGLTPDVLSYNTLMSAWGNAGEPEKARAALDEMRNKGLTPDVVSYTTLMSAWEKTDIPVFATDNGYQNYILPLIKNAIGDGVLSENAGYDKRKNAIDFHLSNLLLSSKEYGGATVAFARAIVDFHYHEGNLECNPSLIVGRHGSGAVREAVLSELCALSDNYGNIFNYVVDPLNPGMLIVRKPLRTQ